MTLIGGGYAERVLVAARQCRVLPDDVTTADGALAEPLAVALHAVLRSQMKPGARVAILGAGPIGLLVAFWARRLGANRVAIADLNTHQRERALQLGATGFALSNERLTESLAELCGGAPDIVFECVGRRGLIETAMRAVRLRGTVVGVGLCLGGDEWNPFVALSKKRTSSSPLSSTRKRVRHGDRSAARRRSPGAHHRPDRPFGGPPGFRRSATAHRDVQGADSTCQGLRRRPT